MTRKDGQPVIGPETGLAVMKRQVEFDASYVSEQGEDVRQVFLCDMFKEIKDEELRQWQESQERVAAYIGFDVKTTEDGRKFQSVRLTNIRKMN